MSVLSVLVGQCGNQIGREFYSMLKEDENIQFGNDYTACDRWFRSSSRHSNRIPRSVLVDTEQKVIESFAQSGAKPVSSWSFDTDNLVTLNDGGAGNNWALGYVERGPKVKYKVMECIRKEAEQSDKVTSLLIIAGSAGGTGSGVGSYVTEYVKQEYSTKHIVNIVVLPYSRGEVVTQNYNSLLTCAKLYDVCDMHVLFQNDHLYKMVSGLTKPENIGFKDLNALIALKMMAVFQPVEMEICRDLPDVVSQLTPHPGLKLVSFKSAPHVPKKSASYESSFQWESLVRHILQTFRINSVGHIITDIECKLPSQYSGSRYTAMKFASSISNLLFTRGLMPKSRLEGVTPCDTFMFKKWSPSSSRYVHCHSNKKLLGIDKFIALASNNMLMFVPLEEVLEKAWNMYTYKAYLHQYKKYGVTEDDFMEAFAKLESVVRIYKDIE